ncbi:hypothetical protein JKA74_00660 [Marivirga sp. S37H4]|uniref:Uncharacterized protein n=1 Tax=Marivirga aurantiaca TaxID=2802615 RepID=A0A934WV16_9BACT|nr:hypothetical protein [Marivirga aurantiaca]MBK6263528.1 hypothetical protein [Marivirga aurantiaca]
MKKFQLLIPIILFFTIEGFSQIKQSQNGFEILKEDEWLEYRDMMNILKKQNRINKSDAAILKQTSSNSFVAFEQTTDSVVNEHGKISEENIQLAFRISALDNPYLILITSYLGFCHSFKYDLSEATLSRILNKNNVILSAAEVIKFDKFEGSFLRFYTDSPFYEKGDWRKYFILDLKNQTFAHKENCRIIKNKQDCKVFGE